MNLCDKRYVLRLRRATSLSLLALLPIVSFMRAQSVDSHGISTTGGPGGGLPGAYFHSKGVESVNTFNLNVNVKIPIIRIRAANGSETALDLNYNSNDFFVAGGSLYNAASITRDLTTLCVPRGGETVDQGDTLLPDDIGDGGYDDTGSGGYDDPFDTDPPPLCGIDTTCGSADCQGWEEQDCQDCIDSGECTPDPCDPNDPDCGPSGPCDPDDPDCEPCQPGDPCDPDGGDDNPDGRSMSRNAVRSRLKSPVRGMRSNSANSSTSNYALTATFVGCDASTFQLMGNPNGPGLYSYTGAFIKAGYTGGMQYPDGYMSVNNLSARDFNGHGVGDLSTYNAGSIQFQTPPGFDDPAYTYSTLTDSLGRAIFIKWSMATNHPREVVYSDDNGVQRSIFFTYRRTNFWLPGGAGHGCHSSTPDPCGDNEALQTITFPNGQQYHFEWYINPDDSNSGLLAKLYTPEGGYTRFVYHWRHSDNADGYVNSNGQPVIEGVGPAGYNFPVGLDRYDLNRDGGEDKTAYTTVASADCPSTTVCHQATYPTGDYEVIKSDFVTGNMLRTTVFTSGGTQLKDIQATYQGWYNNRLAPEPSDVSVSVDGKPLYTKHYDYDSYFNVRREVTRDHQGILVRQLDSSYLTDQDNATYGMEGLNYLRIKTQSILSKDGTGDQRKTDFNWTGATLNSTTRWHNGTALVTNTPRGPFKNPVSVTSAAGRTTTYGYSDAYVNGTDCGVTASSPPNTQAFPTTVTDALGHVSTNKYTRCGGQIAAAADPNDVAAARAGTTYLYDCVGAETARAFPDGGQTTQTYPWNCSNTPDTEFIPPSLPLSVSRTVLLDQARYTTSTVDFDVLGRVQAEHASDGSVSESFFDGLGRLIEKTNPHGASPLQTDGAVSNQYDALGRTVKSTDQMANVSWSCYNGLVTAGQPSDVCDVPTGHPEVASWVGFKDPKGSVTRRGYDSLGQLRIVIEANQAATSYTYNAFGELKTVDQPGLSGEAARSSRTFDYDDLGRLISATNPETGAITYGYDADDNLTSKTDARGLVTSYTYDALNRLISRTYSDGTPGDYFAYDVPPSWMPNLQNTIGRLANVNNAYGGGTNGKATAASFSYDAMGRVTQKWEQTPNWSPGGVFIGATYDLAGNQTLLSYPDGTQVANHYDAAGRLDSVWPGSSVGTGTPYVSAISYAPSGAVQSMTYGNGVVETLSQNNRLQPCWSSLVLPQSVGGITVSDRRYFYGTSNVVGQECIPVAGNNGNIQHIVDALGGSYSQDFNYDSLNRITQWSAPNMAGAVRGQDYNYDSFGNLWQSKGYHQTSAAVGTPTARMFPNPAASWAVGNASPYTTANRLADGFHDCVPYGVTGTPGQVSVYDPAGNLLCDGSNADLNARQYSWDGASRITQVNAQHNGNSYIKVADYVYNQDGDRARANQYDTSGNVTSWREYIHFGGQVINDYSPTSWNDYIFAGGKRIARVELGERRAHVHTENANANVCCRASLATLPVSSPHLVQTGDVLYFRQLQTAACSGLFIMYDNQTAGMNWLNHDSEGNVINCSSAPANEWHTRRIALDGSTGEASYVGKHLDTILMLVEVNAPDGPFDLYIQDVSVVNSQTGAVWRANAMSDAQTLTSWANAGTGSVSNLSAVIELSPTAATGVPARTISYYGSDHLGTAQMEMNASGYPVSKSEFAPFGQELSDATTTANRYKYTGKERDTESGLDYFGARYYASSMGRWMSPDWAAKAEPVPYAKLDDPQSLNLYEYVRNNPLGILDPDGHGWWKDFGNGLADSTYRPFTNAYHDPKGTWNGIKNAASHPGATLSAIGSGLKSTAIGVAHGDGRAIGQVVGTGISVAVGGGVAKGVGAGIQALRGAAVAGAVADATVTTTEVYRAVDAAELQSIKSTGQFLPSPNGTEYKGFFSTAEGAQNFSEVQAAGGGPATTVVTGTAPNSLLEAPTTIPHSAATEGPGYLIPNEHLPQVTPK